MGFHGFSAKSLVDHLMDRYGNIITSDLEAYRQALAEKIEVDRPIDVYLQRLEDAIQSTQVGNMLFTPAHIVQKTYHSNQQYRTILPGAQGVAQKEGGRPDLYHIQESVCGRISRPGRINQGHKRVKLLLSSKHDAIDWRGTRSHLPGIRGQKEYDHKTN